MCEAQHCEVGKDCNHKAVRGLDDNASLYASQANMKAHNLVKADFVTALVLIALGIGAAVESWRMPRLEERGVQIYSVPGIVPGLLGLVIALLGLILLVRSIRAGGYRLGGAGAGGLREAGAERLLLALVLTLGYAVGLIGNVSYWLATGLFLFAFIVLFEWDRADVAARRLRKLATALLQAVLVTVVVGLVFQKIFLVHLP